MRGVTTSERPPAEHRLRLQGPFTWGRPDAGLRLRGAGLCEEEAIAYLSCRDSEGSQEGARAGGQAETDPPPQPRSRCPRVRLLSPGVARGRRSRVGSPASPMRRLKLPLVLLLASAASGSALGAPPPAPPPSASSTVADDVQRGDAARRAGRWTDAAAAYRVALERAEREGVPKEKRAAIAGEIGLCELRLGKHLEAAEHLFQSLIHRDALPPNQRARFESGIAIAEARLGIFVIETDPTDAEVIVDGRSYGSQEAITTVRDEHIRWIYVEPGTHRIIVRAAGHLEGASTEHMERGNFQRIRLTLHKLPPPPPTPPPKTIPDPKPRSVRMEPARSPGGTALRTTAAIVAGTAITVGASFLTWGAVTEGDLEEQRAKLRRNPAGKGACGVAAPPAECAALSEGVHRRDVVSTIGWVSLAAGGAIGLVTAGSFLVGANKESDSMRLQVVPVANGEQAAVVLRGVW